MHCYETIYIMHPDLGDDGVEAAKAKVDETLGAAGGRIYHRENWGKKRLAYTVAKQQRGIYQLIQFIGSGQTVADLERLFRLDEAYIKHLIVRRKEDPATAEAKAEEDAAKMAERAAEKAADKAEKAEKKAEPAAAEASDEKPARARSRAKKEAKDTEGAAQATAEESTDAPDDAQAEAPAKVGD
jgi:small subunit ribosomal protein S6